MVLLLGSYPGVGGFDSHSRFQFTPVAQLDSERLATNQKVAGSSPAGGTKRRLIVPAVRLSGGREEESLGIGMP